MHNRTAQPMWIRSHAIPVPETGRLSVSVWLRSAKSDQQPPLRIAIEAQQGDQSYYRFGSIGSLSPTPQLNQISSQWQRFAVHFDDLPPERLTNLKIGFDLMGPGEIEIDQIEIYDRWFDELDAKAITQRLASCGPLLATPATWESSRLLLSGYWLQFLDNYFRDQAAVETAAQPANDTESNAEQDDSDNKKLKFRRFRRLGSNWKDALH
jgi:hypothetical protein